MNHSLRLALSALCGLMTAAPLAAQTQQQSDPGSGQTVTVTGPREDSEAERRGESGRFFDSHAVRTRIGQLARWHEPICVRTGGLPLALNARISTRIMDIADSVGIRTSRADLCRPNVMIGFTTEPQAMVERAARRNPLVIGFHYAAQRDRVMRVRQPVQAWYVTTTRGGSGEERIDQAGVRTPGGGAGSRLTNSISSGLAHVLIFADTNHVEGEETASIADLLAFLALAQTPVAPACDASDTILNLMNPACPPERRPVALTQADIAYLRALYSMAPEAGPPLLRGQIVLDMAETLGGR